ncbi:hypothetical protein [Peptostreptococcus faecalis]|uniref:hypothetical protein n=1 Tax=Peptostreptococcus faecalis TaxID=2045015 RepID=UPI000C7E5226|nr:hypothetical protein [Peptostreptococcus faecalis]
MNLIEPLYGEMLDGDKANACRCKCNIKAKNHSSGRGYSVIPGIPGGCACAGTRNQKENKSYV